MKKYVIMLSILTTGFAFADNENYDGQDVYGSFSNKSMINSSWRGCSTNVKPLNFTYSNLSNAVFDDAKINAWFGSANLTGASFVRADLTVKPEANSNGSGFDFATLKNVDFTGANLSGANFQGADVLNANFTDTIINDTDFGETYGVRNFVRDQLYSTRSYKEKNLTGIIFGQKDLSYWDFSHQNLQNSNIRIANLNNTNFIGADFRGSTVTNTEGNAIYRNTIGTDGVITNISMTSADDSMTIRAYVPATSGGTMINAKIVDDAEISGGAVLTLEQGAVLEVASGKSVSVLDDSEIIFNVDVAASDATKILLGENSKLVFGSDSKITINLDGDFSPDDSYTFSVIETVAGSQVIGTDSLKKENVILNINGETYDSEKWGFDFDPSTGSLNINVNVPEPATYAAIFGMLALGFAAYRRRR